MKVAMLGTGHVGLVQGVVMADFGLDVICMDVDEEKIQNLRNGKVPIFEPGLRDILERARNRIEFTTDMQYAVQSAEVLFITVGTPTAEDGSADLKYVLNVAEKIGQYIDGYKVVADKSTVPVGTGRQVKAVIQEQIGLRGEAIEFDVVSNPEFLREGKAVKDCQLPNRIVIGHESERARDAMKKVYDVLYLKETPFIFTNIETAEMIKYASNAFLAVKISYINEMALLSEKVGADVQKIAMAMGMDGRISPKFLNAGPGYGGSCFPKDTRAIVDIARQYGEELHVIDAAIRANEKQKRKMVEKILERMGSVDGKAIGVLGLSFKPETDDMRESPAIDIIRGLVGVGATIKAYCPQGVREAKWRLEDIEKHITYCMDEYDAAKEVEGLVIITDWNQFRGMDLEKVRALMNGAYLFDLRNIFVKDQNVREHFEYYPTGRL